MKESNNPLYQLISEQPHAFKKKFQIHARSSLASTNYYMLFYALEARNTIKTSIGKLTPVDAHVTIYEENKKEMENSAFHLTLKLTDEIGNNYCVRIFYNESGGYLFDLIKDEENNSIELKLKEELLNFGKKNIQNLLTILLELQQAYEKQYKSLIKKVKNHSKVVDNNDESDLTKTSLLRYENSLCELINYIQGATFFNQKHLADIKIHQDFLHNTQQKLNALQSIPSSSTAPVPIETTDPVALNFNFDAKKVEKESLSMKMEELNKKIMVVTRSKKTRTPSLILQEHDLYQQKLNLIQKTASDSTKKNKKRSNSNNSDDELMIVLDKHNQLQEEINSLVLNILSDESQYKKTDQQNLYALIKKCSIKTSVLLQSAVEYNRAPVLEHLIAQRKDLNVNCLSVNQNVSMLELAYKKQHLDIFKILLQHKASPDLICTNKEPILYCACDDGRIQEMELLLKAGANALLTTSEGFNALAALALRHDRKPDLKRIALFLTYAPYSINHRQGRVHELITPLSYACQEGWESVVKFWLEQGADPNIKRDDGITALGVCVYKNNLPLFKIILQHSLFSLKECLSNALDLAVVFQEKGQDTRCFIEEIIHYNDLKQQKTDIPDLEEAFLRLDKCHHTPQHKLIKVGSFFLPCMNKQQKSEPEPVNCLLIK